MWDDRDSRKYVAPHGNSNNNNSVNNNNNNINKDNGSGIGPSTIIGQWPNGGIGGGYGNRGYDNTEDLHAWSIYRQNLNADLSESAIGINKSSNTERPFGNFQLKETTVKNILNHPKYGPRLRDHDPATYLRYGLPRAKVAQSELGGVGRDDDRRSRLGGASVIGGPISDRPSGHHHLKQRHHSHTQQQQQQQQINPRNKHAYGHPLTSDSASISDDDDVDVVGGEEDEDEVDIGRPGTGQPSSNGNKRKNVRRPWKSDPDLLRGDNESGIESSHHHNQSHHPNHHHHHNPPSSQHQYRLNKQRSGQPSVISSNKYSSHLGSSPPYLTANGKAVSETDLRYSNHQNHINNNNHSPLTNGNGYGLNGKIANGFKGNSYGYDNNFITMESESPLTNGNGLSSPSSSPKYPHLIVRGLYYELDKTSTLRRICGAQRTKSRILDNIAFEVKAGEVLAIMATNGKN